MLFVSLQIVICLVLLSSTSTTDLLGYGLVMAQNGKVQDTLPLQLDELGRGQCIPPMKIDPQVRQHLESVLHPILVSHSDEVCSICLFIL